MITKQPCNASFYAQWEGHRASRNGWGWEESRKDTNLRYTTAEAVLWSNNLQLPQQGWESSKPYAWSPRMCLWDSGSTSQPNDLNDELAKFGTVSLASGWR